jgi:hypothetical protein
MIFQLLLTEGRRQAPRRAIQKYKISIECWGLLSPTLYSMIIAREVMGVN